jgi:hypothetical protein
MSNFENSGRDSIYRMAFLAKHLPRVTVEPVAPVVEAAPKAQAETLAIKPARKVDAKKPRKAKRQPNKAKRVEPVAAVAPVAPVAPVASVAPALKELSLREFLNLDSLLPQSPELAKAQELLGMNGATPKTEKATPKAKVEPAKPEAVDGKQIVSKTSMASYKAHLTMTMDRLKKATGDERKALLAKKRKQQKAIDNMIVG